MDLVQSKAFRWPSEISSTREVYLAEYLVERSLGNHIEIGFDIGSNSKHEGIRVAIGKKDFSTLIAAMLDADRNATIRAFSKALLTEKES